MIVALGKLALTVDTAAGRNAEPLLYDQAFAAFQSPDGSQMELRGALVVLGLSAAELRAQTTIGARTVGYEVGPLASFLYALLLGAGADPLSAPRALLGVLAAKREATQAATAQAASTKVERPHMTDPYPGLTRAGETWPDFSMRKKNTAEDLSVFEEWKAAAMAWDAKRIDVWVAEVGGSLGFRWEPPGEG